MSQHRCTIDDCDRAHYARGWCGMHYKRWLRNGSPIRGVSPSSCAVDGCERQAKSRGWCHAHYRLRAGLPAELTVHCLRHSYVSHLIEDGVDPLFVQHQVGHSWASTTAIYTSVGADAKNRMLHHALGRAFDSEEAW